MDESKAQELVEWLKELGHELVKLDREYPVAALRYVSGKMAGVMDEVWDYLEGVDWELRMEEMWEEAGMQSEEDAEY